MSEVYRHNPPRPPNISGYDDGQARHGRRKGEELTRRNGNVMDCHATARGSNPGGNGVFTELHVLRKGQ